MTQAQDVFAGYVATLGRGPGRSRALTRTEAEDAMALMLRGAVDPVQIGAFLMLLRYRGEDAQEIAGLVTACRAAIAVPDLATLDVALDWPSYGAGKTRGAPWFVLAALALGRAGIPVLMHGSNDFSAGISVAEALSALELKPSITLAEAAAALRARGFAYLPLGILQPRLDGLLGLRRLLGLRSPLNTVCRLLNPAAAAASLDGVFHPPYLETHLAVAEALGQPRLLVLKGGGGEAERNPAKPATAYLWSAQAGRSEIALPALISTGEPAPEPDFAAIWHGEIHDAAIEARIVGTIALGLLAVGGRDVAIAQTLWESRLTVI